MALSTPYALLLLLASTACTKSEKVPAYVEVPAVTVSTTGAQGSSTSKITDAWVSVDDGFIGVWELPARIPVLAEGSHKVTVVPAIKRNGTYDDRLRYPFYAPWEGVVDMVREGTLVLAPQCAYIPEAEFWIEDFEDAFAQLNVTDDSDTTLIHFVPSEHPELTFVGNSPCGGFRLDAAHDRISIYTDEDYVVYGGPVFLELDYRSDVVITIGVLYSVGGTPAAQPYLYLTPTRRSDGYMPWNKIYVDLSPAFDLAIAERDVYIEAVLPAGQGSGEVYLDNFKLLRILQ